MTQAFQGVDMGQQTHIGWKLVMAQSECWFFMMMYQVQSIFTTELDNDHKFKKLGSD
jgi:hypothetical protein